MISDLSEKLQGVYRKVALTTDKPYTKYIEIVKSSGDIYTCNFIELLRHEKAILFMVGYNENVELAKGTVESMIAKVEDIAPLKPKETDEGVSGKISYAIGKLISELKSIKDIYGETYYELSKGTRDIFFSVRYYDGKLSQIK
jgi:hypothetical protein